MIYLKMIKILDQSVYYEFYPEWFPSKKCTQSLKEKNNFHDKTFSIIRSAIELFTVFPSPTSAHIYLECKH